MRTIAPSPDLDVSWMGGLHLGARQGLGHGSDLLFTYGPLGFLNAPQVWAHGTALLAVVFVVAVRAAFLAALLVLLGRVVPFPAAVVLAYLGTRIVVRPATELLALAVLMWALHLVQSPEVVRWRLWLSLGVVVSAVELLVKFGDGLYSLAILTVTASALGRPRVRSAVVAVGATLLLTLSLWVAIGQSIGDLGPWVIGNLQLAGGYTAMAVEEPGRGIEYVAALLYALGLVALLVTSWTAPRRVWAVLLLLGGAYVEFSHGFIRHNRHSLGFFLFLLVLPFALRLPARARPTQFALAGFALVALAVATQSLLGLYLRESVKSPVTAAGQLATLASPDAVEDLQARAREDMRAFFAVDPEVLAAIGDRRVQIDPFDTGVVWAYELAWGPVPVFQTYAAFTPALDQLNADALTDGGAPERILRARHGSIDDRFVAWESPRYTFTQLCRYREVLLSPTWQVLAQAADRCGSPESVGSVEVAPGQLVQVPAPTSPDRAVFARVELPTGGLDRLLGPVFKPLTIPTVELDGQPWRIVTANLSGPLLLRVPDYAPAGPGPGGRLNIQTLRLPALSGPARVEFYEVPLAP